MASRQPDVDVLVVGAGITGIYQLHSAREAGFRTCLWEAGGGVGGTWFWNRYPGARFDSESYTYGYFFSEELFREWEWSEHFAAQPETERYLNHVVDRFDLRRDMRFGRSVESATFDEPTGTWLVESAGGEALSSRFLVAATGVLSVPYLPDIPGRDSFRGAAHHTGQWPSQPVDVRGKRVAVVGTSSSGVQVVPAVLPEAASLTVYQRSANWCTPLNNGPITDDEQADLRARFEVLRETMSTSIHGFHHPATDRLGANETPDQRQAFFETMWASPGFMKFTTNYLDLLFNDEVNDAWGEFIAGKIRSAVHDPATAELLVPKDHRYGQKRPPYVTGYFEAFNDPRVSLVDLQATPFVRVTDTGIETTDGLREFDIIVWATGFDFGTGALSRMGVRGVGGRALMDHWADGPRTFLGISTHGFPNLFFPGGPHAAAGNNPRYNGDQVDFVTRTLVHVREAGGTVIEVTAEAEERWTNLMNRAAARNPFGTIGQYVGGNIPGKNTRYLLNAAGRPKLHSTIADVIATDFSQYDITQNDEHG